MAITVLYCTSFGANFSSVVTYSLAWTLLAKKAIFFSYSSYSSAFLAILNLMWPQLKSIIPTYASLITFYQMGLNSSFQSNPQKVHRKSMNNLCKFRVHTIPKIWNIYSQKESYAASFPIIYLYRNDLYSPTSISPMWNIHFLVFCERTLSSKAGAEIKLGNCRKAGGWRPSLPSPVLLRLSREVHVNN